MGMTNPHYNSGFERTLEQWFPTHTLKQWFPTHYNSGFNITVYNSGLQRTH